MYCNDCPLKLFEFWRASLMTAEAQGKYSGNMWSRRSAIERCPSPWNRIRKCPTVTDNGLVKGTDILLKQIQCSNIGKSLNIIVLHWPVICYCWAFMYSVSWRRASLDRRSTTPHVLMFELIPSILYQLNASRLIFWTSKNPSLIRDGCY